MFSALYIVLASNTEVHLSSLPTSSAIPSSLLSGNTLIQPELLIFHSQVVAHLIQLEYK